MAFQNILFNGRMVTKVKEDDVDLYKKETGITVP